MTKWMSAVMNKTLTSIRDDAIPDTEWRLTMPCALGFCVATHLPCIQLDAPTSTVPSNEEGQNKHFLSVNTQTRA